MHVNGVCEIFHKPPTQKLPETDLLLANQRWQTASLNEEKYLLGDDTQISCPTCFYFHRLAFTRFRMNSNDGILSVG